MNDNYKLEERVEEEKKLTHLTDIKNTIKYTTNDTLYNLYKKLHSETLNKKNYIVLKREIKNLYKVNFKLKQLFLYFCYLNKIINVNFYNFTIFLKKTGLILSIDKNKNIDNNINYNLFENYLNNNYFNINFEPIILGFLFSHNLNENKKKIDINIQDLFYLNCNDNSQYNYYFDKFNIQINTFFENDIYTSNLHYIELPNFYNKILQIQQSSLNDFNEIKSDDSINITYKNNNNLYKLFNTYINKMFLQINYNFDISLEELSNNLIKKLNNQTKFNSNNNIIIKFIIKYINNNYIYHFNKNDPYNSIKKIDEYINNTLNNYIENTKSETKNEQGYNSRFKHYDFLDIIVEINEKKYKITFHSIYILIHFNFITMDNFMIDYNKIINFLKDFINNDFENYFQINDNNLNNLNNLINNKFIYIYNTNIELHINTHNLLPIYYTYNNLILLLNNNDNFYINDNNNDNNDNYDNDDSQKLKETTYITDKTTELSFQYNNIINTYKSNFNKDEKFIIDKINLLSDILFKKNIIYKKYIQYFFKRLSYFTFTYKNFSPGYQPFKNSTYNNNVHFSNLIINTFNFNINEIENLKNKIIDILFNNLNTFVDNNIDNSSIHNYNNQYSLTNTYSLINITLINEFKIYYNKSVDLLDNNTKDSSDFNTYFHFYYPQLVKKKDKYIIELLFENEFDKLNNNNRELDDLLHYYNYMFESYYQNNKILSQIGVYNNENHDNEPLYLHEKLFKHILDYDTFFQEKLKNSMNSYFNIDILEIDFLKNIENIITKPRDMDNYKTNIDNLIKFLNNKKDKLVIPNFNNFFKNLKQILNENNNSESKKLLKLLLELKYSDIKSFNIENEYRFNNKISPTEYLIVILKSIRLTKKIFIINQQKKFNELSLNINNDFNCNKQIIDIINDGIISNSNKKFIPYNFKYNILQYKQEHIILCPSVNNKICPYYKFNFNEVYENISCISNSKKPNIKIFNNIKIKNFINFIFDNKSNNDITYLKYINTSFIYQFTNLFILYYINTNTNINTNTYLINYIDPNNTHLKLKINDIWDAINMNDVWNNIKKDFISYLNSDKTNIFTYQNNIIYLKYNGDINKYISYLDTLFNNNQLSDDNLIELLSKTYNFKFIVFISNFDNNVYNIKNINNYQIKYNITDIIFIIVYDIYYNYYYILKNSNDYHFTIKNEYMSSVLNSIYTQFISYNVTSNFIISLSYKHSNEKYNTNLINILDIEQLKEIYNIKSININKSGFVFSIILNINDKTLYIPFNYILNELIFELNLDISKINIKEISFNADLDLDLDNNEFEITNSLLNDLSDINNKFKPENIIVENNEILFLQIKSSQLIPLKHQLLKDVKLEKIELKLKKEEDVFKKLNDYDFYLDKFINDSSTKTIIKENTSTDFNLLKNLYYKIYIEYYKIHKSLEKINELFLINNNINLTYYNDLYNNYINTFSGIDEFYNIKFINNKEPLLISQFDFDTIKYIFNQQYNNNFVFRRMLYSDKLDDLVIDFDNIYTIYSSEIYDIIKKDTVKIRKYNKELLNELLRPIFTNNSYNNNIPVISHENYDVITNISINTLNNSKNYINFNSINNLIEEKFKIKLINNPYYHTNNDIYNFVSHYNKNIFYYLSIKLYKLNKSNDLYYIYDIILNNILKLIEKTEYLNIYHILQYYTKMNYNNSYYNINTQDDLYNIITDKHWLTELDLQFLSNEFKIRFIIFNKEDLKDIQIIDEDKDDKDNKDKDNKDNNIFLLKEVHYYMNIYHFLFLENGDEDQFEENKNIFNSFFDIKKENINDYLDESDDDLSRSPSKGNETESETSTKGIEIKGIEIKGIEIEGYENIGNSCFMNASLQLIKNISIMPDISNIIPRHDNINKLSDVLNHINCSKDTLRQIRNELLNIQDGLQYDADDALIKFYEILLNWPSLNKDYYAFSVGDNTFFEGKTIQQLFYMYNKYKSNNLYEIYLIYTIQQQEQEGKLTELNQNPVYKLIIDKLKDKLETKHDKLTISDDDDKFNICTILYNENFKSYYKDYKYGFKYGYKTLKYMKCENCNFKYIKYEPTHALLVNYNNGFDIEKEITNIELIDSECSQCQCKQKVTTQCKQKVTTQSGIDLSEELEHLIIYVKRQYTEDGMNQLKKIDNIITYGLNSDISFINIKNNTYKLKSFIVHYGTETGGHYVNYSEQNGDYYIFNDNESKKTDKSIKEILHKESKNITVLLYVKGN